jgi:IMP dehydrogenase|tara:strand:+ start:315 stop:1385 length:1071 start_codon:yes stop_codon:yes gene_type:complete
MRNSLTYDDIQLVPKYSNIPTRTLINLKTLVSRRYGILNPIVASPMDTVCGLEMAYKIFLLGGVGCIHRFNSIEEQSEIIKELNHRIYSEEWGNQFEAWGVMLDSWHSEISHVPIMAAIGVSEDDKARAKSLVDNGCNIILIDVAHGHHENVEKMLEWCKSNLDERVDIIAGNIATKEAAQELESWGADGLRVGIGGGSLCTTRIRTGFGVPNVSCLEDITSVAKTPVMADGGIRSSGDISKALAIGASSVMLGSLIAGTDEAPGQIVETQKGLYKRYRGSASLETKVTHGQTARNVEGESTTIPYKGGVKFIVNGLIDGVKSALSYGGAQSLKDFNPSYVQVTNSGINEAKPHLL